MGVNRRGRRRPERASARPTWWVLLAVSMAIMALIFARSAGTTHRSTSTRVLSPSNPPTFVKRSTGSATQTPELKQLSPIPTQPSNSGAVGTPKLGGGGVSVSPSPPTPTSTTVTAGTTIDSYPGYLIYPYNVVSSYPIVGAPGSITASATWPTNATLDVSISCPSDQRSSVGTSTVSVSMATTTSPCTVHLSEVPAVPEPVAYDLTVTITPDS